MEPSEDDEDENENENGKKKTSIPSILLAPFSHPPFPPECSLLPPLYLLFSLTWKLVGEQPKVHRGRLAVAELVRRRAGGESERRWGRSRRRQRSSGSSVVAVGRCCWRGPALAALVDDFFGFERERASYVSMGGRERAGECKREGASMGPSTIDRWSSSKANAPLLSSVFSPSSCSHTTYPPRRIQAPEPRAEQLGVKGDHAGGREREREKNEEEREREISFSSFFRRRKQNRRRQFCRAKAGNSL